MGDIGTVFGSIRGGALRRRGGNARSQQRDCEGNGTGLKGFKGILGGKEEKRGLDGRSEIVGRRWNKGQQWVE